MKLEEQNRRLQDCLLKFAAIHIVPSSQEEHEELEEALLFEDVEPLLIEILGYNPFDALREAVRNA